MARPRQPIDLVVAKGKKHLTKAEIEERKKSEIKVEFTDIQAPSYLPKNLTEEFDEIAFMLKTIGIMTELDVDLLARYLLSKQQYLYYTNQITKAITTNKIGDCERWSTLQDKSFKQCRACASDLGLTITSRCKLVVPQAPVEVKTNKFDRFKK